MSGALDPKIQQEIIDRDLYATAVLSGNRNFDGRIHPYAKQAFLASPPLVVAYAIAGTMRFDIEKDVLGVDVDGKEDPPEGPLAQRRRDRRGRRASVKPEQFRKVYDPMFALVRNGEKVSPLYDWRPQSTYIRRPPYWEGALAGERTLRGMRPLAVLGDNITTDHLSPSNAILLDSAAGEYLAKMGLPEEDFNSYATHRGDHLTAQRATFANPTLVNEMVVVDGKVKKGSLARVEPEGTGHAHVGSHRNLHEPQAAADHHRRRRLRPGLLARLGGQGRAPGRRGSHRRRRLRAHPPHQPDRHGRAAAGVQARHHRKTLGIDGTETYDVIGERTPRATLTLVIHRKNGERVEVPVTCRLDTAEEVSIYEAGGVLQRFAQDFLASLNIRVSRPLLGQPWPTQPRLRIPATYMRGGTSKGVFFRLQTCRIARRCRARA
jgi:aconitate hydratase